MRNTQTREATWHNSIQKGINHNKLFGKTRITPSERCYLLVDFIQRPASQSQRILRPRIFFYAFSHCFLTGQRQMLELELQFQEHRSRITITVIQQWRSYSISAVALLNSSGGNTVLTLSMPFYRTSVLGGKRLILNHSSLSDKKEKKEKEKRKDVCNPQQTA